MARNLEVKATTKYHHQISIGRADPRKWIFYYLVFWLRVFEGFIGPEGFFSKLLSLFTPYVTSVNFHFFAVPSSIEDLSEGSVTNDFFWLFTTEHLIFSIDFCL